MYIFLHQLFVYNKECDQVEMTASLDQALYSLGNSFHDFGMHDYETK